MDHRNPAALHLQCYQPPAETKPRLHDGSHGDPSQAARGQSSYHNVGDASAGKKKIVRVHRQDGHTFNLWSEWFV